MINNTQLAVTGFSGAIARTNSKGKVIGKRFAFTQECAAGDIRRTLRATGVKGKALTAGVDKVLRGDSTLSWACLESTVSAARSQGFVPTLGDLNKTGSKLTIKFERPTTVIDKETALVAVKQLSDEELAAEMAKRKEAAVAAQKPAAINV